MRVSNGDSKMNKIKIWLIGLFLALIVFVMFGTIVLLWYFGVNPSGGFWFFSHVEQVEIEVKQIIPLPTGTFISISVPLNINRTFFDSLKPKIMDNKVAENEEFAIPIQIKNKINQTFYDTKIKISYNKERIYYMHPFKDNKEPLINASEDISYFQEDFYPSDISTILLVGKAKPIEGDLSVETPYTLSVLDENNIPLSIELKDSITITKARDNLSISNTSPQ